MSQLTFNAKQFQQTLRLHLAQTRLDQCANESGVSMGTLSRLCHGERQPSLSVLLLLCGWMDIPPSVFIVSSDEEQPCIQCILKQQRLDAIVRIAKE